MRSIAGVHVTNCMLGVHMVAMKVPRVLSCQKRVATESSVDHTLFQHCLELKGSVLTLRLREIWGHSLIKGSNKGRI